MSLYKSPRSDCWYISISHNGQRIRKSAGTADKKQAQEYHDKLKHDLWPEKRWRLRVMSCGAAKAGGNINGPTVRDREAPDVATVSGHHKRLRSVLSEITRDICPILQCVTVTSAQ